MAANRQGKMRNLIHYRMRVTLQDSRQMVGQMLAFDQHMNLVLADTEEFRRIKRKQAKAAPGSAPAPAVEAEEKRTLGLTIVRGAQIISLSVDGPPPQDPSARLGASGGGPGGAAPTVAAGPGISRPAGRGLPVGLTGPAAGVGGPGPGGFGGGFPPQGFPGRGGPPGAPPGFPPPQGFPGAPQGGAPGFQPPPGFQPTPGGRGFPPGPPGFGGR